MRHIDTLSPETVAYLTDRLSGFAQKLEARRQLPRRLGAILGIVATFQALGLSLVEPKSAGPKIQAAGLLRLTGEQAAAAATPPTTEVIDPLRTMRAWHEANPGPICETPRQPNIKWLPDTVKRWHPFAVKAEQSHGIPADLTEIIGVFESLGHPGVVSGAGAVGVNQIMPATAQGLANIRGLAMPDLANPAQNLDYSAFYLRRLLDNSVKNPAWPLDRGTVYQLAVGYHSGPRVLKRYQEGLPIGPRGRDYADHVALAWEERGAERSSALDDWLSRGKARELMDAATAIPIDDCSLTVK